MAKMPLVLVANVVAVLSEFVERRVPAVYLNDGELIGGLNDREPTGRLVGELPDVYTDRTDTNTGRGVTPTLSSQCRIVYATDQGDRDVVATGYAEAAVYDAHHRACYNPIVHLETIRKKVVWIYENAL
ncbi:hypothetical protein BJV82DRAFT_675009 [Fennellomyces sp. T-0311]|nr:hypothetical protein BJV82DRAFT_675009 [Fennellomyces sp. T-0311]